MLNKPAVVFRAPQLLAESFLGFVQAAPDHLQLERRIERAASFLFCHGAHFLWENFPDRGVHSDWTMTQGPYKTINPRGKTPVRPIAARKSLFQGQIRLRDEGVNAAQPVRHYFHNLEGEDRGFLNKK